MGRCRETYPALGVTCGKLVFPSGYPQSFTVPRLPRFSVGKAKNYSLFKILDLISDGKMHDIFYLCQIEPYGWKQIPYHTIIER